MVGVTGFEPAISCSRSKRDTKLRYTPIRRVLKYKIRKRFCQVNLTQYFIFSYSENSGEKKCDSNIPNLNDAAADGGVFMNPVLMALLGGLFTWGVTALGASTVFFFRKINEKVLNFMLGFSGGIMISASFWSLLKPALEMAKNYFSAVWIPIAAGFAAGGAFLFISDKIVSKSKFLNSSGTHATGIGKRAFLLVLAITVHNIPEGMAFGVAFGSAAQGSTQLAGAIALTVGIGLQNFPEGMAVSVPLRTEGMSRFKSFMFGQLSAVVEPISAIIGALIVRLISPILPIMLAFAAGAMIFVVVDELIPEACSEQSKEATVGALIGFLIMTVMDIAL